MGIIPSDYQQRFLVTPRLMQQRIDLARFYKKFTPAQLLASNVQKELSRARLEGKSRYKAM